MILIIETKIIIALYGVYFPQMYPTAMSAANISQTSGFLIGALFSTYICTGVKTWLHFGIIIWTLISYCILILRHLPKQNKLNLNKSLAVSQQTVVSEMKF
jgi:hypothetical protein